MAATHINFAHNDGGYGTSLRTTLNTIKAGRQGLLDLLAIMATMIDGDGSNASHYTAMQPAFGFASTADAKAAWDELQSLKFKLTTDGSVDHVDAAQLQAFAKFG
jgi:hypothetical protein